MYFFQQTTTTLSSKLRLTEKRYTKEKVMYNEVKHLENLAIKMGFNHEDIIMFESLTTMETVEALIYGYNFVFAYLKNINNIPA